MVDGNLASASVRTTPSSWVALCYHDVTTHLAATGGGPGRFSVPTAMFERMLDTIHDLGYRGCSLAEALASRNQLRVAITFDDANRGQYERAMPALRARGMTATIYVATDWVGRPDFMTWDELRRVRDWGMSVQSHTRSHPFLSELDAAPLRAELESSKEILDRELRQDTKELAFPGGDPPRRRLRHLIGAAGYRTAVGTRWGTNRDGSSEERFVKRCTVRGAITREEAERFVLADRWLALRHGPPEAVLRTLRTSLGSSRYARWRRRFLDLLVGGARR